MVAQRSKTPTKETQSAFYAAYVLSHIIIDGDALNGWYINVVSQSDVSVTYQVKFVDEGKNTPVASACECYDHTKNHNTCKHMELVNKYFANIAAKMAPKPVAVPVVEVEIEEEEFAEGPVAKQWITEELAVEMVASAKVETVVAKPVVNKIPDLPLNGNRGFSLLKQPLHGPYPARQHETW